MALLDRCSDDHTVLLDVLQIFLYILDQRLSTIDHELKSRRWNILQHNVDCILNTSQCLLLPRIVRLTHELRAYCYWCDVAGTQEKISAFQSEYDALAAFIADLNSEKAPAEAS